MRHNFRDLEIWKGAFLITEKVYQVCALLPDSEKFGLKSQIQRCAVSIPSNIAEGSGRTSDKEFIHFLNIAQGSSYELETQLLLIQKLFNIEVDSIILLIQENQRMTAGLKRKLT
ncbi:MAG: four helix bundle protein [Bacteroidota bacterium]